MALTTVGVAAFSSGCASYVNDMARVKSIEFNDVSQATVRDDLDKLAQPPVQGPQPSAAKPFVEIEVLDDESYSWSQIYAGMAGDGVVIFDANGDDLPDIYVTQNGQNWTRNSDGSGVLMDEPRYQCNMLYLNQGNDANGNPTFAPMSKLGAKNGQLEEAELLIEGFLQPRKSAAESPKRWGRAGFVATAADVNGDGRLDLIVGNSPPGMMTSVEESQRVVPAFIDPVGRSTRPYRVYAEPFGLSVIDYQPKLSLNLTRESSRGIEPEGANSLYLNMGDSDGDGVPEWKDVSRETGIEGIHPTSSIAVADYDLDGDLDIFFASYMDEDFSVPGSRRVAGGANEFFKNELVETGELRFTECAAALNVDGVYDEDNPRNPYYRLRRIKWLPLAMSLVWLELEPYHPEWMAINGEESEHAQISWASVAQDVNHDGYPDIWVGNDFGWLRLYINQGGKGFKLGEHARTGPSGFWMSFAPADFDADGNEDLFVGNVGGVSRNPAIVNARPSDMFDPTLQEATIISERMAGKNDSTHVIIDGSQPEAELSARVYPSAVMPPDSMLNPTVKFFRKNKTVDAEQVFDPLSLDPYEFAWGTAAFDAQNDGWTDLYWVGGLTGRPGSVTAMMGINPGRLLINHGRGDNGGVIFSDQTAEHHVHNIEELKYDRLQSEGYIYRDAPKQNWRKRDVVFSFDRSSWSAQGPMIETGAISQDMMQTAENGRAAIAADLNSDGFADLVVRNKGGYDSRRSSGKNLKVRVDGQVRAVPAHNNYFPSPTNYDPGRTRIFMNQYADSGNHWLKVKLIDEDDASKNRFAVGARVTVNGRLLKVVRSGEGSYVSNIFLPLLFGLGDSAATTVRVEWPDQARSVTELALDSVADQQIVISKQRGLLQ